MTFVRRTLAAAALLGMLPGCAAGTNQDRPSLSERSPVDLFTDYIGTQVRNHCTPVSQEAVERSRRKQSARRFQQLLPWLDRHIGREEMRAIRDEATEAFSQVYFTGCPDEGAEAEQAMLERSLIAEMERRQRAEARLTPPSAGRPSDRAHSGTGARSLPR
ncbi:hypothetical protein AB2M62_13500 [Sphingomonas sp. MMS12-HWE2-04]|uniref:hypothetical protein n=1 Tax=Sphingomonas sp. MMS12-HWE2-04 TaxID=3234199 RepID=UPI00384EC454